MDRLDSASPHPEPPLALPSSPPEPGKPGFPLLATLAPVIGALGLWAVTGSIFSLAFAALGPIVAVASMFDARRQSRRQHRLALRERALRLDELRDEIMERHAFERGAAWRRSPSARQLIESPFAPDWRDGTLPLTVLGRGTASSVLRVDGTPVDETDRAVLASPARLADAPVLADPEGGIGFVGALPLARAAARAVVVQGANHAIPGALAVRAPGGAAWAWVSRLPHSSANGARVLRVVEMTGAFEHSPDAPALAARRPAPAAANSGGAVRSAVASDACVVAVAARASALPPGLRTVVHLDGPASAMLRRSAGALDHSFLPDLIGEAEALEWAEAASRAAARAGLGGASALPERVVLGELEQPPTEHGSRSTLGVAVGAVQGGRLVIDLVRDGPHALVAGTTGSGKSEFLLAWLTALASAYPPDRVSFLLVDFKGGAAFEPIRDLPHVTGIVTDLDEGEAERAVASLRAELRHRETVLLDARARDIAELDAAVTLARLIIVVDEFQAMIERFPGLGAVIADIAARGRSLGVHLVLASQRPNGVVREQVVANCAIRVSLRVVQRADSIAVVGTPAAAEIPPDAPGRGVVDRGDGCPVPFHSAIVDAAAIEAARSCHPGALRARRPWLDPLPHHIGIEGLASLAAFSLDAGTPSSRASADADGAAGRGTHAFGVVDEPDLQRRSLARWSPAHDGHLLVAGVPGSGRSAALAALAHSAASQHGHERVSVLEGPRSSVWDLVHETLDAVRHDAPGLPRLLVIDDLDTRFGSWPDDYRHAVIDALEAILRESRTRGLAVVAAISQPHGLRQSIRDAFGERLLLRHATRSDLVQAGGAAELWRARETPGAGQWRGQRLQVAAAPPIPASADRMVAPLELVGREVHAVASARPRADADALRSLGHPVHQLVPGGDTAARAALDAAAATGGRAPVLVGDVDAWASAWSVAAYIREDAVVVVHGGAAEYRALARGRGLPPLLDDELRQCWVARPGERVARAAWPTAATTETVSHTADRY